MSYKILPTHRGSIFTLFLLLFLRSNKSSKQVKNFNYKETVPCFTRGCSRSFETGLKTNIGMPARPQSLITLKLSARQEINKPSFQKGSR